MCANAHRDRVRKVSLNPFVLRIAEGSGEHTKFL
jgi:hypothetical protein